MKEVEYITRNNQVIEEIEYGDCFTLEIIYPKWRGFSVWYVTPLIQDENFNLTEPVFVLFDGSTYRLARQGNETTELTKFLEFYFH